MTGPILDDILDEPALVALAGRLARVLVAGDCVALRGDLGAGKTTFARALIRAFVADPALDVPSPTFALRQDYAGPRGAIVHLDLYRITEPLLRPIRRAMPNLGGIDISPVILILLIILTERIIIYYIYPNVF